jgi:hypothetical protein
MKAAAKRSVVVSAGTRAALKAWDTMRAKGIVPGKPKPPRPKLKLVPHTPIKLPKEVKAIPVAEMLAKTVVLVLTFNGIGNRRKVDSEFQIAGESDWFNTTKKLFKAEELDEITSIYNKHRLFVETRALPSHIKKGVHLLPVTFVDEINTDLKQAEKEVEPLVESMAKRLPSLKAEAKARLSKVKVGNEIKNFYDDDDYLTPHELRSAFRITWRFVYVDSAKSLQTVSPEVYAEECKKAEAAGVELRETIQQLLRTQFQEKVNHFIDRLTPDKEGKTKIFREGSVDKFQEFLTTWSPRDITNDVQMRVLVDKAKGLLNTADVDRLRTDEAVRDYVRHGFETIQTLLDPMVVDKPHRRILLED